MIRYILDLLAYWCFEAADEAYLEAKQFLRDCAWNGRMPEVRAKFRVAHLLYGWGRICLKRPQVIDPIRRQWMEVARYWSHHR